MESFRLKVVLAYAAVYLIWGSTYLAIRFGVETLPPFLMAGVRFIVAGSLLYGLARARGAPNPTRPQWRSLAIIGLLLLVGGNGGVTWAEQVVPSGITALLIATTPLWVVLLEWLAPGGRRPGRKVVAGVALGILGIVVLIGPQQISAERSFGLLEPAVIVMASLSWAAGSVYSRRADLPGSPFMATAVEMLNGGLALLALATLSGEWGRLELAAVSLRSALALLYLIVFGALIAFTAYIWILRVSSADKAATYAFVNPVVAVFLGWALADEALGTQTLAAAGIIVAAVFIITTAKSGFRPRRRLIAKHEPVSTT
ncbi:MAG: drug/metabolite exporter YedA [Candidatus Promineifilaceae bacterium]